MISIHFLMLHVYLTCKMYVISSLCLWYVIDVRDDRTFMWLVLMEVMSVWCMWLGCDVCDERMVNMMSVNVCDEFVVYVVRLWCILNVCCVCDKVWRMWRLCGKCDACRVYVMRVWCMWLGFNVCDEGVRCMLWGRDVCEVFNENVLHAMRMCMS
jgi:hypothetical protein